MLSHICSKRMVWLLLVVSLVSCASPQESSQVLAEEILEGLPSLDRTTLLNTSELEVLSGTGVGTHFGVQGLYGSHMDYPLIVGLYRELLPSQGWIELAITARGNPIFCNPDYEGVHLSLARLTDLENERSPVSTDLLSEYEVTYQTLYVITVIHYPFDEVGTCE